VGLAALLVVALYVHLHGLAHAFIAPWDEAVHAVVAAHIRQHPLVPTLYDTSALAPAGLTDWTRTHIWIHLPPLGLWASALSMRLFGLGTLQLRLPGVAFSIGGMLTTYAIGRRVAGVATGLVAAAVVGFAPYALLVAQGYVFGDLTDTPLLALGPLTVLLVLRWRDTGGLGWAAAAGVAQGAGILAKGPFALATAAVLGALMVVDLADRRKDAPRLIGAIAFVLSAALVALPYYWFISHAFPEAYAVESGNWARAFFHSYEGWGRPWDFHLTEYLYAQYGSPLAMLVIGGTLLITVLAVVRRQAVDVIAATWVLATYIPITLAVSKADPFSIPAIPAVGLVVGRIVMLAARPGRSREGDVALALISGAALVAILHLAGVAPFADQVRDTQYQTFTPLHDLVRNTFDERVAPLRLALFATVTTAVAVVATRAVRRGTGGGVQVGIVTVGLLAVAFYWGRLDLQVSNRSARDYDLAPVQTLAALVSSRTPSNATVAMRSGLLPMAHGDLMIMFWSGRDVYETGDLQADRQCGLQVRAQVTRSPLYYLTRGVGQGTEVGSAAGWSLYRVTCAST
jgi:4-amino-4-deoxy-L-arabinose transferase-like glycosyltransferase